jgi:RNA polymerase sigma-70 factor, ECF subfamily
VPAVRAASLIRFTGVAILVSHAEKVRALPSSEDEHGPTSMTTKYPEVSNTSSDAELAAALIAGNPLAPREAWRRFVPLVGRMSRRVLGAGADVDDVVQEVFACLFRSVPQLRAPEALRAFVITVTKRMLGHELRRRRARAHLSVHQDLQLDETVGENGDPATRHAYLHFRHLLGRLNDRERRAFVLRFVACMDAPEVAQTLGVSVPTARRAFSRAQNRLTVWAGRHPFLSDFVMEATPLPSNSDRQAGGASDAA